MPRFHFDLVDHETVEDLGGRLCEDAAHAIRAGNEMAADLHISRLDLRGKHYKVVVKDSAGRELHRAAIDRLVD